MKNKNGRKVKKLRWNRSFVVLASVLVLIIGLVGTTLAYLFDKTDAVTNTFTPSKVTTTIEENLDGNVKKEVKVKNDGTIDSYIRVKVIINWQDESGNVYPDLPEEGKDYTIRWTKTDWVEYGGYYYYTKPVAEKASTGELFTDCQPVAEKTPDGYELCVMILADGIQAQPADAVKDAWGVEVNDDGTLKFDSNAGGIQ